MLLHVVVTGAGGFVGGFVARWLAQRGFAVTAITRRAPDPSRATAGLTWHRADLLKPDALPGHFDALLHCAAEIPAHCPDPDALYRNNADAARNVFNSARAAGAQSVVFLSSMSVYGTVSSAPVVTEDTTPDNPDPYGSAKRDAEDLLKSAVAQGLASGLAIRLPGTVGKGSHHNFLSDTLARVRAGETVYAKNPDAPFNNIVHVGDLAAFLEAWIHAPRPGYAVTNLAAEEPLAIRDVLALLFSCASKVQRVAFETGGKAPFLISLERARALGYRPSTVRESVKAFVHDSIAA